MPGLESQYEQIYAEVRGGYLSSSVGDTAAGVLSAAQGRPGQSITPGTLVRVCIAMLEVASLYISLMDSLKSKQSVPFSKD
jgi:hypothetical protein